MKKDHNASETLENVAQKAAYVVLRFLRCKEATNEIFALSKEWKCKDASSIYPDLLQAARMALYEHGTLRGAHWYDVIGVNRNGRKETPFKKACCAVKKELRTYSNGGLRGKAGALAQIKRESTDTEAAQSVFYLDDKTAHEMDDTIHRLFKNERMSLQMIDMLRDGYSMAIIIERLQLSKATAYRMKDRIAKRLFDSGDFDDFR